MGIALAVLGLLGAVVVTGAVRGRAYAGTPTPASAAVSAAADAELAPTAASAAAPATPAQGLTGARIEEPFLVRLLRGVFGIAGMLAILWVFSAKKKAIDWSLIGKGLLLQVAFAFLVLKTTVGRGFFSTVNDVFIALIGYTNSGARFVFGSLVDRTTPVTGGGGGTVEIASNFAFSVLPTIIFFSALMTLLYYVGVMQWVVKGVAWLMQRTLKTSGAETTSAAGNIFVGQTEAPLLIKPFVSKMTMSELNTVMTGGFATVAGGVMAAYVAMLAGYFPTIAGHLLAASIMAAPGGIIVSKLLMPETETPETGGRLDFELEETHVNVIDAAAGGAADGLGLALNVGAMLLAFLALIALGNGILGWGLGLVGVEGVTLELIFGWLFAPVAWMIGVPWSDAAQIGSLFGVKMIGNEFIAFQLLADWMAAGVDLAPKSIIIATYALTGFANFASVAIQIGGIGGIAPERRHDLSRLGLRAMLGGTAATWMTATLAGVLA